VDVARFVQNRSASTRLALARYLACDPRELKLEQDALGKPTLAEPHPGPRFDFSASHCGGCSLVALSPHGPVGIDVERLWPISDIDGLAETWFVNLEARTIACLQGARKIEAFFNCWTYKEAYTKALGTGLRTAPDTFAMPGGTSSAWGASTHRVRGDLWTLYRFAPWPGYTAAIVVAGRVPSSAFHIADCRVHPRD
jgi:4'-phosphopantetheinyl transferase